MKNTIVYDIGANKGDNIPYYLKKADVVVAVEANPVLCHQIHERFLPEINQNRLIVENCVLTATDQGDTVCFYIHKYNPVLSQFPQPRHLELFEQLNIPSKSVSQLFKQYGFPYYVKIDIEGYDHIILRSLFKNDIRPLYISAESHSIEVFLQLTSLGCYNQFKVVEGATVAQKYQNHSIKTGKGEEVYSFRDHSSGPFGEDVPGNWIDSAGLFQKLQLEGLGWKDIHAKRNEKHEVHTAHKKWQFTISWTLKYWSYKILWLWFYVSHPWKVGSKVYFKLRQKFNFD